MSKPIRVAHLNEIPNHGQLAVEVSEYPILLFRRDDEVYALDDICTHTGDAPLGGGGVEGYTVTCPWHGTKFDIRTGKNLCPPAMSPTGSHHAHVEDGAVFVTLRDDDGET